MPDTPSAVQSPAAAFNQAASPVHSITQLGGDGLSPPPQTPAPEAFASGMAADVVIVGGGYTGLSAALHLAQEAKAANKPLSIVVLEAGTVGSAASGKSGGHVGPGFQEHDEAAVLKLFPSPAEGRKALALAAAGPGLVEKIIHDNAIDCDLRRGYVVFEGKTQTPVMDGSMFGIEPYPYVLGLAAAARALGVTIYEHTPVSDITETAGGVSIKTPRGDIAAKEMLCSGGHRMAETIPLLAPLRHRTLELLASTIITDPLPAGVLEKLLPGGARLPFATDDVDVAYGTIDRENRIIFGAKVGALKTDPAAIAKKLAGLFPDLNKNFRQAAGKDLGWKPLVSNETLNLTADLLPNVGRLGDGGHVRYVHGLGGHGIALGTLLGKLAADDIFGGLTSQPALQEDFTLLSKPGHQWMPSWKPLRVAGAYAASEAVMLTEKLHKAAKTLKFWKT